MKLKIVLVLFVQLLHISPASSARKVKIILPESPFIAKEGESKQLYCILEASESPPPASFGNVFVYPTPTAAHKLLETGKNITVSKETKGLQTITTVKFDPLSIDDVGNGGFYCTPKAYPSDLHVDSFILPKRGVPNINFTSTIPTVSGAEAVLNCEATLEGADVDIYLTWLHYKWNASVGEVVSAKEKPERSGKPPKKAIKSVLKVILDEKTAGTYECVITAKVKKSVDFNYTRNAILTSPIKIEDGVQAKQTLQVYQKKEAVMVCQAVSVPPAIVIWKKGNNPIQASSDSRYRFSRYRSTEFGTFVIKDVDFKDRGVYTCKAMNNVSFVTMEFTLRIRDPLGALWPFIGIVIEAIVLAVIILVYEYYKNKNKAKKAIESKEKETSPLLSSAAQPGIAYTAGEKGTEGSVKMRPSTAAT